MNQKNPTENEFALAPINTQDILITERGIDFSNFAGLWTVANMILRAKMAPEGLDTPHAIALVIARGRSVGLDPFQAMESMAPVGGKVMIYGDSPLAICRQHPQWLESAFDEFFEQEGKRLPGNPLSYTDKTVAVCITQRDGGTPKRKEFSVADAKQAHIWGKKTKTGADTGWITYPHRMLMFRARGYALRDNFGDALKGISIRETFDEEVDGKPPVSNVDELREEIDKRKGKNIIKTENMTEPPTIASEPSISDKHFSQISLPKSSATAKVINRFESPEALEQKEKHLDEELSELDQARDWLKTLWEKMPIKWDKVEALKKASREEGDWIAFEHIENISDIDYLNRIAARLEEALSQIKKPGFTANTGDLEAHTKEQVERNKAKA